MLELTLKYYRIYPVFACEPDGHKRVRHKVREPRASLGGADTARAPYRASADEARPNACASYPGRTMADSAYPKT